MTHKTTTINDASSISLQNLASGNKVFYVSANDCKRYLSYTRDNVMCDKLETVDMYTHVDGFWISAFAGNGYQGQNWIYFDISGMDSVADVKTWLASNPLQVVYELATPITYTLTPQQVETLIGTNNIWSDAGEVTVEIADDPNKIVNPTLYDAKPLIKVSGYGTVQVGSVTITIEGSASDVTYIDCDSMECYRLNGLAIVSANSAVSFSSYDFPVLEADSITGVTYSTNVSQVQIVPRWWQL